MTINKSRINKNCRRKKKEAQNEEIKSENWMLPSYFIIGYHTQQIVTIRRNNLGPEN